MEAMAMRLPVVATRICGVPELVDDGVSGRLVTPGRTEELADALALVLRASADERAQMGQSGRDKVLAEFDRERTSIRLLNIYGELLGDGPGRAADGAQESSEPAGLAAGSGQRSDAR
jgi:glycosyltransferase involved in cell wall biosynthesis